MRLSTVLRVAWSGSRNDWLRVVFTAVGAALGVLILLAAATVFWLPPTEVITGSVTEHTDYRYSTSLLNETVRRPWLAAALVLLTLPALTFAGQSARLGAPSRDRRLAAFRLAGATPGQTRLIAIIEATVACVAGAILGIGSYFLIRALANKPVLADPFEIGDLTPRLPLPTDALPPLWTFPAIAIAVPALAALLTAIALRRVIVTPLTVNRRMRHRKLRWWPLALIVAGFAMLGFHLIADRQDLGDQKVVLPLTAWTAVLCLTFGVALCAAPLGQVVAQVTQRFARRPEPLLAARWIIADPWSGSRSLAVVLVSVLGAAAAIRGITYARAGDVSGWVMEAGIHRFSIFVLVMTLLMGAAGLLFAIVEGLLTRRRALASLVAAGAPKSMLARAVLLQALLPAVPAVVLAIFVGTIAVATAETQPMPLTATAIDLAVLGGGALLSVTVAAALSLVVLRAGIAVSELRTE